MKLSILLIDDDSDDSSLFGEILAKVSPDTIYNIAKDGVSALEMLHNTNVYPDLIFMDLNMPRMGGKECLERLKSDASLMHLPVVMYTTSSHLKDKEDSLSLGATGFITKPSGVKEMTIIIQSIVEALPNGLNEAFQELQKNPKTFVTYTV